MLQDEYCIATKSSECLSMIYKTYMSKGFEFLIQSMQNFILLCTLRMIASCCQTHTQEIRAIQDSYSVSEMSEQFREHQIICEHLFHALIVIWYRIVTI